MKKLAIISAILITTMLCSLSILAVTPDDIPAAFIIDDASIPFEWKADGAVISKGLYTTDMPHAAAGEGDDGYVNVKNNSTLSGRAVTAKRTFDSAINLYAYTEIKINTKIDLPVIDIPVVNTPESDVPLADSPAVTPPAIDPAKIGYTLLITLFSGEHEYTYTSPATAGSWQEIIVPVADWSRRTEWTAVSVSVTVAYADELASPLTLPLSFSIDNLTANGIADTTFEDTFMSTDFSSSGGKYSYLTDDNAIVFDHNTSATLTGVAAYKNRNALSSHNMLRLVLASDVPTEIKLLVTYIDGEGYIGKTTIVSAESPRAFYFELPNASDVDSFTFAMTSEEAGTIVLYGIDTLYIPDVTVGNTEKDEIGSLNTCTLDSDGSINLRGTLSTDTVVNHLDGAISVYAVPLYADPNEYLSDSTPLLSVTMTTRFNITIDEPRLPDGAAAHRYIIMIEDDEEKLIVGSPMLPISNGAGVVAPIRSKSLKGLAHDNIKAGQSVAVTELPIDLSLLFGDLTSGRIHSAFGKLYYFDSEYLKELDTKIRSLSLSGTDIYIRLLQSAEDENGNVTYEQISAADKDSFERLYAAVDFLSQRYSSGDYGYICGIIVGSADITKTATPAVTAAATVDVACIIYGAGMSNINDFRVLLPLGDKLTATSIDEDCGAEVMLRLISRYAGERGLRSYGIMWQSNSLKSDSTKTIGIDGSNLLKQFTSSLEGSAPSFIFMKYAPGHAYSNNASYLLRDYMEAYYLACESASVSGFIYDLDADVNDTVWVEFIRYFSLLDTDRHAEAEQHVANSAGTNESLSASDASKNRAHPYVAAVTSPIYFYPKDIKGSFKFFDYAESFDTGGWFTTEADGECITVKLGTGRAMRAVGGGIMYSCAASPLDLSSSTIIAVNASSDKAQAYELTVISLAGRMHATFTIGGESTIYIDISDFIGITSVTGIMFAPKEMGEDAVYINSISLCSREKTDDYLEDLYSSASLPTDGDPLPEANMIEIIAVVFTALVLSALTFSLIRRRES